MLLNIACSFFLVFFTSTIVKMKLHSSDTRKNSQPKPRPTILKTAWINTCSKSHFAHTHTISVSTKILKVSQLLQSVQVWQTIVEKLRPKISVCWTKQMTKWRGGCAPLNPAWRGDTPLKSPRCVRFSPQARRKTGGFYGYFVFFNLAQFHHNYFNTKASVTNYDA